MVVYSLKPLAQNDDLINLAAGAFTTAIAISEIREILEQSATEWVIQNSNYKDGDTFEVKHLFYDLNSTSDLSRTRSILFKVTKNNEKPKILVFFCSPGWYNQYGIIFTRVKDVLIDYELWTNIMFKLAKVATVYNKNIKLVSKQQMRDDGINIIDYDITANRFKYTKKNNNLSAEDCHLYFRKVVNGDTHILGKVEGTDFVVDFNEGRLNLFNYQTGNLIKFNLGSINNIADIFRN